MPLTYYYSWVMLDERKGFVPLPRERILFTSPPRTALALQTPNSYPGKTPVSINSSGGVAYLTNQRLVYLPAASTPQLQSFSAPILNLQDTHVSAPFFGPNVWTGILQPVTGGGIPPHHAFVEIKMTFKDGGAFDFHSSFERIKETLSQALESARESGRVPGQGQGVDLSGVHLDQLPAYEDIGSTAIAHPTTVIQQPVPITPPRTHQSRPANNGQPQTLGTSTGGPTTVQPFQPPNEPPPGYEEAQQGSVVDHLEESIRRS
ncbi:hypothetical protein MMC32_002925 [Xylographa parallela]|nr:hypothetical protein [Xylographa parallela]